MLRRTSDEYEHGQQALVREGSGHEVHLLLLLFRGRVRPFRSSCLSCLLLAVRLLMNRLRLGNNAGKLCVELREVSCELSS